MRPFPLLIIVALIGVGAYIAVYKRGEARRTAGGYGKAETPAKAAELFKKALGERDFEIAADYCTPGFANLMRSAQAEASEFATKLDNMVFQLNERGLMRDELKQVVLSLDPFPKDFTVTTAKELNDACDALIKFTLPFPKGGQPNSGMWQLKPDMFNVFLASMMFVNESTARVSMKKEGDSWKFDIPVNSNVQRRVAAMKDKAKNYVNPFTVISQEVKTDPTTKENITKRVKELLEQAARE